MIEVVAPMPGTIVDIMVAVGDEVEEDQELMVLEAMKMENPIFAPANGTVKEIKVKVGDKVESDEVLMTIE
jgi:acetyl-CoA carboxylase biotin carboxyl carrier protein